LVSFATRKGAAFATKGRRLNGWSMPWRRSERRWGESVGDGSPLALTWTGRGRLAPKIVARKGSIVHREVLKKVPSGWEGEKEGSLP
jgi:hypothetical protein